jgi:hypothetical protein
VGGGDDGGAVFPLCIFYTQDARSQKRSFLPSYIYAGVITGYRENPVRSRVNISEEIRLPSGWIAARCLASVRIYVSEIISPDSAKIKRSALAFLRDEAARFYWYTRYMKLENFSELRGIAHPVH